MMKKRKKSHCTSAARPVAGSTWLPEDANWSHHRIASTNQHPASMGPKLKVDHAARRVWGDMALTVLWLCCGCALAVL